MPLFHNNPTYSRKPTDTNQTQRLASSVRRAGAAKTHRGALAVVALLVGCLTACSDTAVTPDLMVETREGPVLGKAEDGVKHWLGLPFAAPPIGELRFKAPQPAKPWGELLETTEHRSACVQKSGFLNPSDETYMGSEDCLYLNVYAKEGLPEDTQHPVMVWIHGGGNTIGSAETYNPSDLVRDQNVVVVTTQYRLSTLGWFRHTALRTEDTSAMDHSGNFGTLDTVAALEWVRDNIKAFGGDPNNVTIFGESAGGHNVAALMASPPAQGLFHRAIIQSGIMSVGDLEDAESPYGEDRYSRSISSFELVNELLILNGSAADRIEAATLQRSLSSADIKTLLLDAEPTLLLDAEANARPIGAGMTRAFPDGVVIHSEGILGALRDPTWKHVPVMIGTNRDENKLFNMRNEEFVRWGEPSALLSFLPNMPKAIIKPDEYEALNRFGSSLWKLRAGDDIARLMAERGDVDLYLYRFDWGHFDTVGDVDLADLLGAAHAVELMFLFPAALENFIVKWALSSEALADAKSLSATMRDYWASFALSGAPSATNGSRPDWPAFTQSQPVSIHLDGAIGNGVTVHSGALTLDDVLNELASDDAITADARCRIFTRATFGDGNRLPEARGKAFYDRYCVDFDRDAFIEEELAKLASERDEVASSAEANEA